MINDIYVDRVTGSVAINGVVKVGLGVIETDQDDDSQDNSENVEETIRLRIPLADFQYFVSDLRDALMDLMRQGLYGEEGRRYVAALTEQEKNIHQEK